MTVTVASKTLPVRAQQLLDELVNGLATLSWRGGGTFAVAGPSVRTRLVGPQVRALQARGLLDGMTVTEDGLAAAQIAGDDAEAVRRAYRLAHAPASVLAGQPLAPDPVRVVEPTRMRPRDGYVTHTLTERMQPGRYAYEGGQSYDSWDVDVVLFIEDKTWRRYSVAFYGPDACTRRVQGGDLVKGVWAYAILQSVVIASGGGGTFHEHQRDLAAGRVVTVQVGDVLDMRGYLFVIKDAAYKNIELVRMEIGDLQ